MGVPTSQALSIVHTYKRIAIRESLETTAVVARVAQNWIRFGSFEILYYNNEIDELKQLADFVIETAFPQLLSDPKKYLKWFERVLDSTVELVAHWQSIGISQSSNLGFCHGVLNTDNMSILGITIDLGPFGFMEEYNPSWVCNLSDDEVNFV